MSAHIKTIGVLLLIVLFVWGCIVTDGLLLVYAVLAFAFAALYWFFWSLFKDREDKKRRGGIT